MLFKTYFKLNSISLSKNILRSLRASSNDMPPFEGYPKAHRVTFQYYCGVIHFLEEDYSAAEEYLSSAYDMCLYVPDHNRGQGATTRNKNLELILTYLIPTRLLTSHKLPSQALLSGYPRLAALFTPISSSIRSADLTAFNSAMEAGAEEFVKRRIYLTLERGRDVLLRNLFRKVFIAGGFEAQKDTAAAGNDAGSGTGTPGVAGGNGTPVVGSSAAVRRTRVPVKEFAAALQMAGAEVGDGEGGVDTDEVECLIANAIYKVSGCISLPSASFR